MQVGDLEVAFRDFTEHDIAMKQMQSSLDVKPCLPLLKWPGGKRAELPLIKPAIPHHFRYFEPFFGGGSVFFDAISVESYVNDLHPDLMLFYSYVQQQSPDFLKLLLESLNEWERGSLDDRAAMYYRCRDRYNAQEGIAARRAVDFFLLRELAYGGMFRVNREGHFNVPFGVAYGRNKNLREKVKRLWSPEVRAKLDLLDVSALDFSDFLARFDFNRDDFIFVDPPYDSSFSKYGKVDFDEADQVRLAECLERVKSQFMLVCKLTPLVEKLYFGNGYSVRKYEFNYKFNIKGRFSRSSTHVMVTNYG